MSWAIVTGCRKEVIEKGRDRRTLCSTLFFGRLCGPALFAFMISVMVSQALSGVDEVIALPIVGQAHAPNLVDFLRRQGIKVHLPVAHTKANLAFPRGENHGSLTGWLRDPFVTIGNNVIELAPRSLFHRRQRFAVRHILASTMARGARYFPQRPEDVV